MTTPLPTLFISHGAPSLALERGPSARFLRELGRGLFTPKAILVASAHWDTAQPQVTAADYPATIHDFHGFSRELQALRYPVHGEPGLARRIVALLSDSGLRAQMNASRGLDHGAWVPLSLMFPAADVPVVQLSLQPSQDSAHHHAVGRALAPLRKEGILIMGSGGASHNLGEMLPENAPAPAWTQAFVQWLTDAVIRGDTAALLDYQRQAPEAQRNHPTPEHLLPLFVALGAAGARVRGRVLHSGYSYGSLAMSAFGWD